MTKPLQAPPDDLFSQLLRKYRRALAGIGGLSAMINLLALTGSLYMLQVYDRVLTSRSMPTLVGLTILMTVYAVLIGQGCP